jgi:bla regulator protein blaR1
MSWLFNAFPQEVVSAAGWTLLHSLWQGGIISVFLYLLLYLFRRKNANVKTLISVAALVLFLAVSVTTYIIVSNSNQTQYIYLTESINNMHADIAEAAGIGHDAQKSIGTIVSSYYSGAKQFLNANVEYVFTLWLLGLSFFVIRFLGGLLLMTRTRNNARIIEESKWNEYIDILCERINLKKKVAFGESGSVSVPVAMGFFKPVILFPFEILSGLPQEQVEAIIAHEIAHIKRYDIFINLFQSAAEIIFFFNPFVWWISGKIRLEREYCCDDIAVSQCGDELIYAKALANLESLIESNMPLFAVPLFKNHNQLLRRINRMLQQDKNRNNIKEKFTAAILFIGLLVSVVVFKNANAQSVTTEKNASIINIPSVPFLEADTPEYPGWGIDSTKAKKGINQLNFDENENGVEKRYRVTLKNGKITSLSVDGEVIPKEDYGKYEPRINKKIKEHEAAMKQHGIEMKQHEADMKQHDIDMKKHEQMMKKQQIELEKEAKIREKEMQKHEADMKKHEIEMLKHQEDMQKHDLDMKKHEEDMKKHELDMKKHAEDMKVHEAEMKKHEAFMNDIHQMLIAENVIGAKDKNPSINLTSSKLIVNGKEVSSAVLDKAKKIYQKVFNKSVEENTKYNVNINND